MSRPRSPAPSQPSVPPPHPSSTPAAPSDQPSNLASLALLLHNTTLERDEALKQVASFKRRLESAENILNKLAAPPSNSPGSSSGTPTATTATANPEEPILNPQAALALLNETRERLDAANNAIAESHHRLRSIQMQWEEYDKWHADWVYKGTQSHLAMAADLRVICGTVNPNGVSFASLPAQQFQMRPSASDPGTSSRRPRTTDSEGERATKRHRADTYQRPTDVRINILRFHPRLRVPHNRLSFSQPTFIEVRRSPVVFHPHHPHIPLRISLAHKYRPLSSTTLPSLQITYQLFHLNPVSLNQLPFLIISNHETPITMIPAMTVPTTVTQSTK